MMSHILLINIFYYFRDCWPVTDKRTESAFRKICCIWLQNIQKVQPRISAPLLWMTKNMITVNMVSNYKILK